MPKRTTIALLLSAYWVLGLGAGICFTEGGTDPAHRLHYFIGGNALGISSTALLMGVYARMNVNLAMVIATSGAFIQFQLLLWLVYRTAITPTQGLGILIVGIGIVLAVGSRRRPDAAPTTQSAPAPLVGEVR
jgi:hypothetical protein